MPGSSKQQWTRPTIRRFGSSDEMLAYALPKAVDTQVKGVFELGEAFKKIEESKKSGLKRAS